MRFAIRLSLAGSLQNLSILFMRFINEQNVDLSPTSLLSILFMRFSWIRRWTWENKNLSFNSLYEILNFCHQIAKYSSNNFQFSLWDSIFPYISFCFLYNLSFNSLYEIQKLFFALKIKSLNHFQFSLWDSQDLRILQLELLHS